MIPHRDPVADAGLANDTDNLASLIQHGSEINLPDKDGRTPLIHAAIDKNLYVMTVLLRAKADPNLIDKKGKSALHYASMNQDVKCIRVLSDFGAIIDRGDNDGNTPLSDSVFYYRGNDGSAICLLISLGADPDRPNVHEVTPRCLAESIANYNVSQYFT